MLKMPKQDEKIKTILSIYKDCFLGQYGRPVVQSMVNDYFMKPKNHNDENESARLLILDILKKSGLTLKVVPKELEND